MLRPSNSLRRAGSRCRCGGIPGPAGECAACRRQRLARSGGIEPRPVSEGVPPRLHEGMARPAPPLDAGTPAPAEARLEHDFSRVLVHAGARSARVMERSPRAGGAIAARMSAGGGAILQRQPATAASSGPVTDTDARARDEDETCDWPECDDLCERAARMFYEEEPLASVFFCPGDVAELSSVTVDGCNQLGIGRWVCGGEAIIDCGPDWPPQTSRFFVRSLGNDRLIVRNEQCLCEYTLVCVNGAWALWPEECTILKFDRWAGLSPRDTGPLS